MNRSKIVSAATALALGLGSVGAFAQSRDGRDGRDGNFQGRGQQQFQQPQQRIGGFDNGHRDFRGRGDDRNFRPAPANYRGHDNGYRYGAPQFVVNTYPQPQYQTQYQPQYQPQYAPQYGPQYVADYGPAPQGYRYQRDNSGNLVLAAIATGVIASILLNH